MSSTDPAASESQTASATESVTSAVSSALSTAISSLSESIASSSTSPTSSRTRSAPASTETAGRAQEAEGTSLETFVASLSVAAIVFAVEVVLFVLLRKKLKRVYEPRTYLVPEKRRTAAPASGILNFFAPVFETATSDFIQKSGLDAYFFLRYLLMLLKVFVILALGILPILLPMNYVGGKGGDEVQGLDRLAWSNIARTQTRRYWAHFILALALVLVLFYVFYDEMRKYVRLRQAYLTSPQHRLKASATTVLVSGIPKSWLTTQRLLDLYDAFPGGIRNIWINRDYDDLQAKVDDRDKLAKRLEKAETELIVLCKKRYKKKLAKAAKTDPNAAAAKDRDDNVDGEMNGPGISSGNPHQIPQHLREGKDEHGAPVRKKTFGLRDVNRIPVVGGVVTGVGGVVSDVGRGVGRGVMGSINTVTGGMKKITGGIDRHVSESDGYGYEDDASQPQGTISPPQPIVPVERRHSNQSAKRGSTLMGYDGVPMVPNHERNLHREPKISTTSALQDDNHAHKRAFWNRNPGDTHRIGDDDEVPLSYITPTSPKANGGFLDRIGDVADKIYKPKSKEEYPVAYNSKYDADQGGDEEPLWKQYITEKDRPTMHLPILPWLPSLPLIGKKVDTIYHCRKEIARLNLEIETDQQNPAQYPRMNSAFVQFNQQVAAHMACQAVSHHVPQHMCPRHIEVSPNDVVWGNMKMQWWERYIRGGLVVAATAALVLGWAFPVATVGSISQISYLTDTFHWLAWLEDLPDSVLGLISGVLPPIMLGILMAILPIILRLFARIQGCHTGMAIERSVQGMYFAFLFIQVFLVVSISSGITAVVEKVSSEPFAAAQILAENLPKASNFFFSYLLLQAFSVSGAALLQIATLLVKFVLAPFLDSTAREKFDRSTSLTEIKWGTFFPVYTNLACIGIVYSVISPLILIFNIITFSLFWIVYRYNLLFVVNFRFDTGGLLFPRAINQLFTGIYVMEGCLIGLFFLVRDEQGRVSCAPQGIAMIVLLVLTVIYQYMLNEAFGPLLTYLPITLEDDAAARDKEFAEEQDARRKNNLLGSGEIPGENLNDALRRREQAEEAGAIEMSNMRSSTETKMTAGQKGEFELFQNIADEIEDLSPEERDMLVARAFQHPAIRAKRPVIWIPRDDLGVSDDEIRRTMKFSERIWISNEYAFIDKRCKVRYGRSPPDLDMRDLVEL